MALLQINWKPHRRELRQFASLWVVFFGAVGAYLFAQGSSTAAMVLGGIAAIGVLGWFVPRIIRPLYVVWMALAMPIGWTISHLLLLGMYYLVFTPIGLLMRACGYDPLERPFDRTAKSYWHDHRPSTELDRYFRQF